MIVWCQYMTLPKKTTSSHQLSLNAVLVATLGTEPQVVTAALTLLDRRGVMIERVDVVHTTAPGTLIAAAVDDLTEAFDGHGPTTGVSLNLHPITLPDGSLAADVDTVSTGEAAFRTIYNCVRAAKKVERQVHLLVAGGRKTLSIYGMVAAQMLFDDEDHLWHLHSAGAFLTERRLFPQPGDEVQLLPVPVILWTHISPVMTGLGVVDDPFTALESIRRLQLDEKLETERSFVLGALTPAERRVVELLVREGLTDEDLAARVCLSPRTVEHHLRAAYSKAAAHWEFQSVNRTQLVTLLHLFFALRERTSELPEN